MLLLVRKSASARSFGGCRGKEFSLLTPRTDGVFGDEALVVHGRFQTNFGV